MKRVKSLVPRTPPEGLTEWAPVRDGLALWGLVYEAVWVPEIGPELLLDELARPRRRKAVEVRCSRCGESRILPWAKTDKRHGGYGFLQEDERTEETMLVGSGDASVCPMCGVAVRVKKAAEIGWGWLVADETSAMSAAVVGKEHFLALTGWTIQRRVYRNGRAELAVLPAEAYVFSPKDCRKLVGYRNSYSGTAGYFVAYSQSWSEPETWSESWGCVSAIYGLTPKLVAESCLPNCKLDVYMDSFRAEKDKFPVMYLRLYQLRPSVENLLVSGLPMVLDDLLGEAHNPASWDRNRKGCPPLDLAPMAEVHWHEVRPDRMLGLEKDELRLAREQGWGAFLWRLFVRAKARGERLSGEDIQNAWALGDRNLLELPGQGPVGKSLRYLSKQLVEAPGIDDWTEDEIPELVPGAYADAATLLDYWRACRALGRDLNDPQVRFPRDLIDAHDTALAQRRSAERKTTVKELAAQFRVRRRQLAKYIFEADGLKIVPAWSQLELQKEADALHHCVWTYAHRHASGATAIFFIRRTVEPGRPYFTLEFDERTLAVRQNRGMRNCERTPEVRAFEKLWLSWLRAGARRDERGRPVLLERTAEVRGA